ncbi:transglycosylase SLT domain-containing protein, partial [Candidatus Woesearchaeota archaeon]|nr:transglycosylase SLT domain-containing protein [Candidatus Woesearchaeota archaeon]
MKKQKIKLEGKQLFVIALIAIFIVASILFLSDSTTNVDKNLIGKATTTQNQYPEDYKVVFLSDTHVSLNGGVRQDFKDAVQATLKLNPNMVVVLGDMVNGGRSSTSTIKIQSAWEKFDETILPLIDAGIAVFPVVGNHDAAYTDELEQGYKKHWQSYTTPISLKSGVMNNYYSFEYSGDLHIVLYVPNRIKHDKQQLNWLDEQLTQAHTLNQLTNEKPYRNVFLYTHKPIITISPQSSQLYTKELGEIIKNRISAVFSGHDHVVGVTIIADTNVPQFIIGTTSGALGRRNSDGVLKPYTDLEGNSYQNTFGYMEINSQGYQVTNIEEPFDQLTSAIGYTPGIPQPKDCKDMIGYEHMPKIPEVDKFDNEFFEEYMKKISEYEPYIQELYENEKYQIRPELIKAIMVPESRGNVYRNKKYKKIDNAGNKIEPTAKVLCNGRCKQCNFCGGPGDAELCMENSKECIYYDKNTWEKSISSSCGFCSLMQTNIGKCEDVEECDVERFLAGNPRDAIFSSAKYIKMIMQSYKNTVKTVTNNKLPEHNYYWAIGFAYNNGPGSLKVAIKEITKNKYGGDYSRFNWWELTKEDFEPIMQHFSPHVSVKDPLGRVLYALRVLKILQHQNFKDCGQPNANFKSITETTTKELSTPDTIYMDIEDQFVYQVDPSFSIPLTHDLDVYVRLREKVFLIAKEVEDCHESEKYLVEVISKNTYDKCMTKVISNNAEINLPPKLKLEICETHDTIPNYGLCFESKEKVFVKTKDKYSIQQLTYKIALGFDIPELKNKEIKNKEIKIQGAQTQYASGDTINYDDKISFTETTHNNKETLIISLDPKHFDIKVESAKTITGNQKATLKEMVEKTGAIAAITGGFFNVNTAEAGKKCSRPEKRSEPLGLVVENSNTLSEMFNMDWDCHLMQQGTIDPHHIFVVDKESPDEFIIEREEYNTNYFDSNTPNYALQSGALIYNNELLECPFSKSFCTSSPKRTLLCITTDNKIKLMVFQSLALTKLPSWIIEDCKDLLNLDGGG